MIRFLPDDILVGLLIPDLYSHLEETNMKTVQLREDKKGTHFLRLGSKDDFLRPCIKSQVGVGQDRRKMQIQNLCLANTHSYMDRCHII